MVCLIFFSVSCSCSIFFFFFFNDPSPTEIYTLSLHDALPISSWTVGASGKTVGSSGPTAFAPPMRFFHIFLGRHCCRIASPSQHCSISGLTSRSVCSSYATWLLRSSVDARRRWLVG